jgi:hypothetical protein
MYIENIAQRMLRNVRAAPVRVRTPGHGPILN